MRCVRLAGYNYIIHSPTLVDINGYYSRGLEGLLIYLGRIVGNSEFLVENILELYGVGIEDLVIYCG